MPRITAPTVAQHRAAQHRALLDAARAILAEGPAKAPTLGAVAARAGLARSSAYEYFRSSQDLLVAVIQDVFPRWSSCVTDAMNGAATPGEQVLAYVDANLRLVADGEHAIARALAAVAPGQDLDTNSRVMHDRLSTPLIAALTDCGVPAPDVTAQMINAIVYAASGLIESGADGPATRERARELIAPFLRDAERRAGRHREGESDRRSRNGISGGSGTRSGASRAKGDHSRAAGPRTSNG